MKKINLLFAFLILAIICNAQTWPWAQQPGAGVGEGIAVTTDINNNPIITGYYQTKLIFGTTTLTGVGNVDCYLAKYDPNGNVLWAKTAGGTDVDESLAVSSDAAGNVFQAGSFDNVPITLNTTTLSNNGMFDGFLAKYDSNGNLLWARSVGGTDFDECLAIKAEASGNVYVSGYFKSTSITFGTYTLTNTSGFENIFVVKYDPNGNVLWAKKPNGWGRGYGLSMDGSNVYCVGSFFSTTINFGTNILAGVGSDDGFLVKYDLNGNDLWARSVVGCGPLNCNEIIYSVSADPSGNPYIAGSFDSGTITIGSTTYTNTTPSAGWTDAFVAKYYSNGNFAWARTFGGTDNDGAFSIGANSLGAYVSGTCKSTSFTATPISFTNSSSAPDPMFIVSFDINGNVICGEGLTSGGDDFSGIAVDQLNNAYLTGDYSGSPFAFVIGTNTLTTTFGEVPFLAKYRCSDLGITNFYDQSPTKVFPNPNNGSFKLQIGNEIENGALILFNSLGQKVHEQKLVQGENNIITHNLSKGLYNCVLVNDKEHAGNCKLSIE